MRLRQLVLGSALILVAPGCSGSPAVPTGTFSNRPVEPSASPPDAHGETALTIEGEGLSAVTDLAFSTDPSVLFVQRKDGSVEAWNALRGELVGRASKEDAQDGKLPGNPFAEVHPAAKLDAQHLLLPLLDGVDDARLLSWLKTKHVDFEQTAKGLQLTAQTALDLAVSPDETILVVSNGSVDVANRVSHAHFTVGGWNRGYSSRYGYEGDNTTWAGDVSAIFGPRNDRLVLQSIARRSVAYEFGSARL